MLKNKPVTLIITAALLIVLIVISVTFQFLGGMNRPGMRGDGTGGPQGDFKQGEMPEGFTPPDGEMNGDWTPPDGVEGFNPGGNSNDGSFQRPGGFSGDSTTMKLMQLLRGVQVGGVILMALLGILSIVGILLGMTWGRNWAIVTAVITLILAVPSLFVRLLGSNWIETSVKVVLALAITVLCLLPKSKQASAPA